MGGPACAPGASTAGRIPRARSCRRVRRLRACARPSVLQLLALRSRASAGAATGRSVAKGRPTCAAGAAVGETLEQRYRNGAGHNGRESEFTADTSAEPYGTCATERATQRSPLGTQQGALPYVGPEPRPTAASSRRNEQGRATTGVPSANKVEPSWAHHTRSTDAAIRAGAVVHEACRIPPPIV